MNLYDFDNTIYDGDSCKDIIVYGLKKHFLLTIKSLLNAYKLNSQYKKNIIPFERVKENMLSFIFEIENYQSFVEDFVKNHIDRIKPWYKDIQTENDIIVTASYEIWISLFAEYLGIKHVIATKTDDKGHIIGKNCKKEEKVKRIKEEYPNKKFKCAYSDSAADIPILELASKAYVVEGNELRLYKKGYEFKNTK